MQMAHEEQAWVEKLSAEKQREQMDAADDVADADVDDVVADVAAAGRVQSAGQRKGDVVVFSLSVVV